MDSSIEYKRAKLQEELDRTPEGGTCTLYHSENPGPLVIEKALTVDCINVTIYSTIGPVLRILSPGVVLKNLRVEVTSESLTGTDAGCAIQVMAGATVKFDNIVVRGSILGVKGEEGIWRYPSSLFLGNLAFGEEHIFTLHIGVPVPCKLKSGIQGIDLQPTSLEPGFHKIKLSVENGVSRDTVINGTLSIITDHFIRHICLNGHVRESKQDPQNIVFGRGQVLWEPSDWAVVTAPPITPEENSRVQTEPASGPDLTKPDYPAPPPSEPPPPSPAQSGANQSELKPDEPVIKRFPSPRRIDPSPSGTAKTVSVPTKEFVDMISPKPKTPDLDTTPGKAEKGKPAPTGPIFQPTPKTSNESKNRKASPNLTEQSPTEISSFSSDQSIGTETKWTIPKSIPTKSPPITDTFFMKSKNPNTTSPSSDPITDGDQLGKSEDQIPPIAEVAEPSSKSDDISNSSKSKKLIVQTDVVGPLFDSRKDMKNKDK